MLWSKAPFEPPTENKYPPFEMVVQFRVHGQGEGVALRARAEASGCG